MVIYLVSVLGLQFIDRAKWGIDYMARETTIRSSFDISKIAGPLLLVHLLNWGLFGALSVQVYIYHLAFSNDSLQRKVMVYAIYAAELVQSILFAKLAFREFAYGFGSFEALDDDGIFWFVVPTLDSIVAFVVQVFFAYRIKISSESYVIPIVVVSFALLQLGGGIALGVTAKQTLTFSKLFAKKTDVGIESGIWNGASVACDVIIAASMTYYLSRRRSGIKPTRQIFQNGTRWIIETGTLIAIVAIANFILCLIPSTRNYFETSSAVLGKLYSNTMMAILNSRIVLARNESTSEDFSSSLFNFKSGNTERPTFAGGISITNERWTDPLEAGTKELETKSDDAHTTTKV